MHTRLILAAAAALTCGAAAITGMAPAATTDCVIDSDPGTERCFGDYRQAMAYATDGAVTDAPLNARDAAGDPAFRARLAHLGGRPPHGGGFRAPSADLDLGNAPVVAATLYTGTGYTGESETIRVPRPCKDDGKIDYRVTLGSVARRTESVQPWGNCWIWLYSTDNWEGPRQGPYKTDTADLGDSKHPVLMGLS